jgi:hypothetical protein
MRKAVSTGANRATSARGTNPASANPSNPLIARKTFITQPFSASAAPSNKA